jgi:hypothetical protein
VKDSDGLFLSVDESLDLLHEQHREMQLSIGRASYHLDAAGVAPGGLEERVRALVGERDTARNLAEARENHGPHSRTALMESLSKARDHEAKLIRDRDQFRDCLKEHMGDCVCIPREEAEGMASDIRHVLAYRESVGQMEVSFHVASKIAVDLGRLADRLSPPAPVPDKQGADLAASSTEGVRDNPGQPPAQPAPGNWNDPPRVMPPWKCVDCGREMKGGGRYRIGGVEKNGPICGCKPVTLTPAPAPKAEAARTRYVRWPVRAPSETAKFDWVFRDGVGYVRFGDGRESKSSHQTVESALRNSVGAYECDEHGIRLETAQAWVTKPVSNNPDGSLNMAPVPVGPPTVPPSGAVNGRQWVGRWVQPNRADLMAAIESTKDIAVKTAEYPIAAALRDLRVRLDMAGDEPADTEASESEGKLARVREAMMVRSAQTDAQRMYAIRDILEENPSSPPPTPPK